MSKTRKARLRELILNSDDIHRTRVTFAADEPRAPSNSRRRRPLERFFDVIEKAQQNQAHLCCDYDSNELWHALATGPIRPTVHATSTRITLEELLQQRHRVSTKQKRILAVILALGLLHSGENRWLNEEWNKSHVSFLRNIGNQGTDLSRPYIFTNFRSSEQRSLSDTDKLFSMHRNPSVLSLGFLLLEIDLGNLIESRRTSEDLTDGTTVDANSDLTTAQRLLLEEGDDLYENYKNAVNACLLCDFAQDAEASLDNEEFRKGFYDRVFVPLETELFNGWGTTVNAL